MTGPRHRIPTSLIHGLLIAAWLLSITANQSVASGFEALFEKTRSGVCCVSIPDPAYDQIGTGSGFLADKQAGLIVTNYHCIEMGVPVRIRFANSDTWLPVELAAVRREWDLAVLRIRKSDLSVLRDRYEFRPVSASLKAGASVMAMGFLPEGQKFAVGEFLDYASTQDLPRLGGKFDLYMEVLDPSVSWLRHLADARSGWSGGPVVDATGRLVGVTTFGPARVSPTREIPNKASSASFVKKLLETTPSSTPVDWASIQTYPHSPVEYRVWDVADVESEPASATSLIRAAQIAESALGCRTCKNGGRVTYETGPTRAKMNSPHSWNVFGDRSPVAGGCRACEGTGYRIDEPQLEGYFAGLARRASGLRTRDPRFRQAADLLADRLGRIVERRPSDWREAVNQASDSHHDDKYRPGREAFGIGRLYALYLRGVGNVWFVHRNSDQDLAEDRIFVLVDPTISTAGEDDRDVHGVWGGIVADVQTQEPGSSWIFVRRGFLIAR